MVAQLSFDFENLLEVLPPKNKKRVRYIVPTYYKFYSIYQYDRHNFRKLMNEWIETEAGKNRTIQTLKEKQEEILNKCYVKDDDGLLKRDSDEKHIFRSGTLQKIYSLIFYYCDVIPTSHDEKRYIGDVVCYLDEEQAEIKDTWQLSIYDRLKLHIKLLRLLRKGFNIEEALCQMWLLK